MFKIQSVRPTIIGSMAIAGLLATSAQAAVLNGVFTVNNATITDLYSTTLDNGNSTLLPNSGCVALAGAALQECQFFGGVPTANVPANRAIAVTNTGYGLGLQFGTLDVQYESTTGEILSINSINLYMQDLLINIKAIPAFGFTLPTVVVVTNGNGIGLPAGPFGPPGPVANDQTSLVASGTADQGVAVGQAGIFQHVSGGPLNTPDFSSFLNIVDSCAPLAGGACGLLGLLSLDSDGYRIDGTVNALGGDTLLLRGQTSNNSIFAVSFSTAVVPVPAAVWLFGSALGLMGLARRRRSMAA